MFSKINYAISFLILTSSISIAQIESQLFLEGARITDIKQEGTSIWVATYGQGIYQYSMKDGKWINFSSKSGNLENDLFHCVAASKDFVWAGASEGLFIYSKKTKKWTKRKFAQGGEFGNWIRSLRFDEKKNRLWIGRFRNVTVFDVKANKFTDYNRVINNDEKTNNFNTIAFDGDSAVWFGVESGVHKFETKKKVDDPFAWNYFKNNSRNTRGEARI
jgi:ligand-binding sensor domain-containing protein